jgi:hypothetical protein
VPTTKGREYTIRVQALDAAGNATNRTVVVTGQ